MKNLLVLFFIGGCCCVANGQDVPNLEQILDQQQRAIEANSSNVSDLNARLTKLEGLVEDIESCNCSPAVAMTGESVGSVKVPDLLGKGGASDDLAASLVADLLKASMQMQSNPLETPNTMVGSHPVDRVISRRTVSVGQPFLTSVGTPTVTRTSYPLNSTASSNLGFVSSSVSGVCTNPNCTDPNCPNRMNLNSSFNTMFQPVQTQMVSAPKVMTRRQSKRGKWVCDGGSCRWVTSF